MYNDVFVNQVQLLLKCLPAIREQSLFAIKGGTALNLFFHNMPRLSVDIDLTYTTIDKRDACLKNSNEGLKAIASTIIRHNPSFRVEEKRTKELGNIVKLFVYGDNSMIKIEPNFIVRGTLHPVVNASLCQNANDTFQAFIDNIPILASSELYAGKICATLNRQHPRDLFDIKILFENGGITDEIRQAFVVYLACDARPMHELLSPNRLDISQIFQDELLNMTKENISLDELLSVREKLISEINQSLTGDERKFLLSIKQGNPDFNLIPINHIDQLPAIRWKLINVEKIEPTKHAKMIEKLKKTLAL